MIKNWFNLLKNQKHILRKNKSNNKLKKIINKEQAIKIILKRRNKRNKLLLVKILLFQMLRIMTIIMI